TKTDGVTTATPGGSVTYTITASNAGPSNATGATVADTFPASLTATWTCVGAGGGTCTAAGAGNINDTVNLPSGGSVTYTVSATISAAATGTLSNTATVTAPAGVTDPTPGNNSATDSDTLAPSADLSITKTDGVTTATPGGSVTYTITASNAGPSNATGATVADTFPASLTATWTCAGAGGGTCTAAGSGNINDTVNLPSGGSVTYTVSAAISASATGTLSNTATVTAPAGVTDPTPGNNSATDTDTLAASANLSVTVTDAPDPVNAGTNITYTITLNNSGPSVASAVSLSDTLPAGTSFVSLSAPGGWSCTTPLVGSGGTVSCSLGSFIAVPVAARRGPLAVGYFNTATFTLVVKVAPSVAAGTVISNTATASSSTPDPTPGNESGSTTTTVCGITFSPAFLPQGTNGVAYSQAVTALPAGPAYLYSVVGTLPGNVTLNPVTGVLSGSNPLTGTYPITITATDPGGCSGSVSYVLVIKCAATSITVSASPLANPGILPGGQVSQTYSQSTFSASGGASPYTYTGFGLPIGLSINGSTGLLSGTPSAGQQGVYHVTVVANDNAGCPGSVTYDLYIAGPAACPSITMPATISNGDVNSAYSDTVAATGGTAPMQYLITSGALKPGLSLNSATGAITGMPTTTGPWTVTISAVDVNFCFTSQTYSPNTTPVHLLRFDLE
ncbi:MAG: putative Ig domain-containing protein, partial [Thermoanaerobaculia bacterium]